MSEHLSETGHKNAKAVSPGLIWRIEAMAAAAMFGFFRLLPTDAASALGGWLGRAIGPRLGISKRALINLQRAIPELDAARRREIIRAMWDNLGRVVAEYPHLKRLRLNGPEGRVELVDGEILQSLIAAGKPIIFVSAHFGNWEIALSAPPQLGLPVSMIYRAINNPLVDRLIAGIRDALDVELLPKGLLAARGSIAALRAGRSLGLLVDQRMSDGIPVPFFGREAMTAPAVAQLALRFDCPILPARVDRLVGARFRLTILPPIAVQKTGDRQADTLAIMTRINAELEGWIRARPEMWLWLHRRWPD